MKDQYALNKVKQTEALVNEFKGHLFEFLVAHHMARKCDREALFLEGLRPSEVKLLQDYEDWLAHHRPRLKNNLAAWAQKTAEEILNLLSTRLGEGNIPPFTIGLSGKTSGPEMGERDLKEADIFLRRDHPLTKSVKKSEELFLISLKLCRSSAYVNTKSAGTKSFFVTYFRDVEQAAILGELQESFNREVSTYHQELLFHLLDAIDYTTEEDIPTSALFAKVWTEEGRSLLPGELEANHHRILEEHYHRIIQALYKRFIELKKMENFKEALFPLLGFGRRDMIQVITFYHEKKGDQALDSIAITEKDILESFVTQAEIIPPQMGQNFFSLKSKDLTFQIRIKPMNTFHVESYKINCSIHFNFKSKKRFNNVFSLG